MKKKLELELIKIANEILELEGQQDINAMHSVSRKLYEKLTILKFVEDNFDEVKPQIDDNAIEKKFEELANSFLDDNRNIPESNPHEEDIMIPGMETIKDMVKEMPKEESLEDLLSGILPDPVFIKRDAEILSPTEADVKLMNEQRKKSLNDKYRGTINIGLNDRIAFVKHLFDGNNEDYNRVLSQLNSLSSENEKRTFINQMVKPDHNNWEGKEEFENRFLELIGVND